MKGQPGVKVSKGRFVGGCAAACLVFLAALRAADFEVSRSTIDGGGVIRSAGGTFELSGTIGQPDAGTISGGSFDLSAGFWFGLSPGDCNEDGVVALTDHAALHACMTGPSVSVGEECRCFDLDRSGTIDLVDFAEFQTRLDGE